MANSSLLDLYNVGMSREPVGGDYPKPGQDLIDRMTMLPIGQYEDGSLTLAWPQMLVDMYEGGVRSFEQGRQLPRVDSEGYYAGTPRAEPLDAFNAASAAPMAGVASRAAGVARGAESAGVHAVPGYTPPGLGTEGPLRAWHASKASFDKFDPQFAGSAETGIGHAVEPGAFSFAGSKSLSGPDGGWTNTYRQQGIEPYIYEVDINADRNLLPDTGLPFERQPPGVQQLLMENADTIRSWPRQYPNSTFAGKPYNAEDPKHIGGLLVHKHGDRSRALDEIFRDRLPNAEGGSEKRFWQTVANQIHDGTEASPDLFAPGKSLFSQFADNPYTTPFSKMFKVVAENGGEEIVVTDPSLIRILSRNGEKLAANDANASYPSLLLNSEDGQQNPLLANADPAYDANALVEERWRDLPKVQGDPSAYGAGYVDALDYLFRPQPPYPPRQFR